MTKKEKNAIIEWCNTLNDEQLEEQYYKAVYDCLGSQTEEMYERGYCIEDIKEREEFEDYLDKKADIIGMCCEMRGVELWK